MARPRSPAIFNINSPNHPAAAGDAELQVPEGADIPGIPRHQLNAGLEFVFNDRLIMGVDASFRSGVHLPSRLWVRR